MYSGLYISVPFCRSKCSYCNFASGVFSRERMGKYVDRVCFDMAESESLANEAGALFSKPVDSIYLGGGTPTLLDPDQLQKLFGAAREQFQFAPGSEITVECAPGTLTDDILQTLLQCGVNRVSLGVQSFIDRESASVARLHTRDVVMADIARLRAAGISDLNVDLIAGLPHQTRHSWGESLAQAIDCGVPHVSIYMLEVDEDSRLGREVMAGGARYHAHSVPNEDLTADLYEIACKRLSEAGIEQYEISNFARQGSESKHNLKYWLRQPYFGFGVDAHSMAPAGAKMAKSGVNALRWSTTDELESFLTNAVSIPATDIISNWSAVEETYFLGLRLNRGVDMRQVQRDFGDEASANYADVIAELANNGLVELQDSVLRLTPRGRLLSNEVFERFIAIDPPEELVDEFPFVRGRALPVSDKIH